MVQHLPTIVKPWVQSPVLGENVVPTSDYVMIIHDYLPPSANIAGIPKISLFSLSGIRGLRSTEESKADDLCVGFVKLRQFAFANYPAV